MRRRIVDANAAGASSGGSLMDVHPMEFRSLGVEGWKGVGDVEWLEIGDERLGGVSWGIVHRGRMKFRGEKPRNVAVKRLKDEINRHVTGHGMPDEKAVEYQRCIRNLNAEGVGTPHMSMVKTAEGEWVEVLEVFERGRASKFDESSHVYSTPENRTFFATSLAGIINAGYYPSHDAYGSIGGGRRLFAYDLDELVHTKPRSEPEFQGALRHALSMIGDVEISSSLPANAGPEERTMMKHEMFRQFTATLKSAQHRQYAEAQTREIAESDSRRRY